MTSTTKITLDELLKSLKTATVLAQRLDNSDDAAALRSHLVGIGHNVDALFTLERQSRENYEELQNKLKLGYTRNTPYSNATIQNTENILNKAIKLLSESNDLAVDHTESIRKLLCDIGNNLNTIDLIDAQREAHARAEAELHIYNARNGMEMKNKSELVSELSTAKACLDTVEEDAKFINAAVELTRVDRDSLSIIERRAKILSKHIRHLWQYLPKVDDDRPKPPSEPQEFMADVKDANRLSIQSDDTSVKLTQELPKQTITKKTKPKATYDNSGVDHNAKKSSWAWPELKTEVQRLGKIQQFNKKVINDLVHKQDTIPTSLIRCHDYVECELEKLKADGLK